MKSGSRILYLPQVISVITIINNYLYLSENERFKGGTLVGTYDGIAEKGELIMFEASAVSLEGRYAVLQKDNKELDDSQWELHVGDFAVFGEYTAKKTGTKIQIQFKINGAHFFYA